MTGFPRRSEGLLDQRSAKLANAACIHLDDRQVGVRRVKL